MLKFILVILDGFGLREEREGNAHLLARTPHLDQLLNNSPMIRLQTSGLAVGLPEGVMGNSEVGHMNMGAGRVVLQNLVRINAAIADGSFIQKPQLLALLEGVKERKGTLHLLGLCSPGGVHSDTNHLRAVLGMAHEAGVMDVAYHAMMDGRDTSPRAGVGYLEEVDRWMQEIGIGQVASVIGRYYAMDRDHRWDRIEKAYRLYLHGEGAQWDEPGDPLRAAYRDGIGDEFIEPAVIGTGQPFQSGDALLALNFRADRMRQIIRALTDDGFRDFPVERIDLDVCTMTSYEAKFDLPVLFPAKFLDNLFPEILARHGYRQLRIAETEKYAHVTYFFNGGREEPFEGEDRILVPSPKVATYDLQPAMSAMEVTGKAVAAMQGGEYAALIMNLANPDMVGHTGKLDRGIEAMETVDDCLGQLLEEAGKQGAALFLTADHGNIEMMIDPDSGDPHTAHTTLDVPFVMVAPENGNNLEGTGSLSDIAPTILDYLGLDIPAEMDGQSRLTAVQVQN